MDWVASHPRVSPRAALGLLVALGVAEALTAVSARLGLGAHALLLVAVAGVLTAAPETPAGSRFADPGDRPASLVAALIPISLVRMMYAALGTSTWTRTGLVAMVALAALVALLAAMRAAGLKSADAGLDGEVRIVELPAIVLALVCGVILAPSLPDGLGNEAFRSAGVAVVAMVVVASAAAIDEMIYRGLLQTSLGGWNPSLRAIVVGFLYGVGFLAIWPSEWVVLFALVGVTLGMWREASGSVIGPAAGSAAFAIGLLVIGPMLSG